MKPTLPEFFIVHAVTSEDYGLPGPYCVVVGRCGDAPIPKGECFRAVYRYQRSRYPEEMGDEPVRIDETPVRLEVVEIQTHNRSFEQLGQGMTGALFLRGDGLERLAPGWVIGRPVAVESPGGSSQVTPQPASAARES
jgi:hypothetical protein